MNHPVLKEIGCSIILTASIAAGGMASAHDIDAKAHAAAEAGVQVPDTPAKIWRAIDAKTAELKQGIDRGALADVHHQAYAVRDLVAALPAHSPDLPADKKAKVQASVKFVATLAERLDATDDANDKAAARSNYDKLKPLHNSKAYLG
ncbi:MAG: transporter [Nevskia sp.]|nr:transporter [Nevskia sp.]